MCCDNPIDLGCVNSCSAVSVDIGVSGTMIVDIRYNLAGSDIQRVYTTTVEDDLLVIPQDFFNEDLETLFGIYDQNGTLLKCCKIKVLPCGVSASGEDTTMQVSTSCVVGFVSCTSNTLTMEVAITFDNEAAIVNGTKIRLNLVSTSDGFTPDVENPGVAYLEVDNDNVITIIDADAMFAGAGCVVRVKTNNSGCNHTINMKAQVASYDDLASGYTIGTNTFSDIYTYTP